MAEPLDVTLSYQSLKAKQRAIRDGFPEHFGLRIHRAISWFGRSERESTDDDARFLFLWIAFNSAYADERSLAEERDRFATFFEKLAALDDGHRLYDSVWERFPASIRLFLENRYVFSPFWSHHNGLPGYANWEQRFITAKRTFHRAIVQRRTELILSMLFDRLYTLRNQIIHGGATWNSSINRSQLRDGADILGRIVPIMLDTMMDNPLEDWGKPYYPVVAE